jgi:hypothetical protein
MTEIPAVAPAADPLLTAVAREIEAHASSLGWDRPEQLFALVPTADLVAAEPALAAQLGIAPEEAEGWTPIEQEPLPADRMLEQVLPTILWPASVAGVAAVAERLVLPPDADAEMPEDVAAAQEFAAQHPDRQEVRMVAAVLRDGRAACALRLRSHDADDLVLTGPDLVPALVTLLRTTLEDEETTPDE